MAIIADELTKQELLEMIRDAHDACYLEYMNCPWCSGNIGYRNEWHDELCKWDNRVRQILETVK